MDQSDENTPISITVVDPSLKEGTKAVFYIVKGSDKLGSFEAQRRFNDFYNLRVSLSNRWPSCYIPPIPSKQTLGNTEAKVVQDRQRFLQYFCEQVAKRKYLFYSDEFQTFLRTKNTDIEKALSGLPKQTPLDILTKYKLYFTHLSGKEINTDIAFKSSAFGSYLTKSQKILEGLKNQVKQLSFVKKQYTDSFNNMNSLLIPEYEKNILIEYVNQNTSQLLFTNSNEINVAAREIRDATTANNNFDLVADLIRIEFREVESFQEALAQKESYEKQKQSLIGKQKDLQSELSKLLAGKTTFKSIFTKGSNADQVSSTEKKLQDNQVEIDNITNLCDVMTLILGHDEIDSFKQQKQQKYYEMLMKVAQLEVELNNMQMKFWEEVAKCTEITTQQ